MAIRDLTTPPPDDLSEEWCPVPHEFDPDGIYAISNLGRIRRIKPTQIGRPLGPGNFLKPWMHKKGYMLIDLGGRTLRMHCLVALAFLGPIPPGHEVNHKDGNKAHNASINLEYTTHDGNMKHAGANRLMQRGAERPSAKVGPLEARIIRAMEGIISNGTMAEYFGLRSGSIRAIQTGRKWAWLD